MTREEFGMFWKVFAVVVVALLAAVYITRVETVFGNERGLFVQTATKSGTLDEKLFRVCTTHSGSGGFVRCSPWRSPALSE